MYTTSVSSINISHFILELQEAIDERSSSELDSHSQREVCHEARPSDSESLPTTSGLP